MTIGGMVFVVMSMKIGLLESSVKGHTNVDTETCRHDSTIYCFLACKI